MQPSKPSKKDPERVGMAPPDLPPAGRVDHREPCALGASPHPKTAGTDSGTTPKQPADRAGQCGHHPHGAPTALQINPRQINVSIEDFDFPQ